MFCHAVCNPIQTVKLTSRTLPKKIHSSAEQPVSVRIRRCLRQTLVLLCLGLPGLHSPLSQAAVQGTEGNTSSGNVTVTYVQGLNTRLTGLRDMALGTWGGSGPLTASENVCVGRSGIGFFGTGNYRILARGDGEPGDPAAFTLSNGADRIYYNAYFNDQAGTGGRQQLTGGLQISGQTGFGFWMILNLVFGCTVNNANISIEVPATELAGAAGVYTGTLTLTLIPE